MRINQRILAPALFVIVIGALVVQLLGMTLRDHDSYTWFEPIQDILLELDKKYVSEPDRQKMQFGAIQGMIDTLDDPYTEFIPRDQIDGFRKATEGSYAGIGAEVSMLDGWLTITSPMPGSPALEAGIQAGDQVRAIDGVSTEGEPIDSSVGRLTGPVDTEVVATVFRRDDDGGGRTFDVTLTRRQIQVQTVEGMIRTSADTWNCMVDPDHRIAYIRVEQFTQTTPDELRKLLLPLVDRGMAGLVLDLRFNPGGSLAAALDICDLFLASGKIVGIKDRSHPEESISAHAAGTLPDFSMIVLVNGQSASASEITAGALKDNGRAKVLGTRTFGKGLVQEVVHELESGAGWLKLTTAHYYLPSGRNIHKQPDSETWGVDPDEGFYLPLTMAEMRRINRIQRDLQVIREGNGSDGHWDDTAWILNHMEDPQLAAAVESLQSKITTGDWKATGRSMADDEEVISQLRIAEERRDLIQMQLDRTDREIERLQSFQTDSEPEEFFDIIPDDQVIKGGVVEIKAPDGRIVSRLTIKDQDLLEAALYNLGMKPVAGTETDSTEDDSDK